MYFQQDIETMPRQRLERLQLERLRWVIEYCYKNNVFYYKRLSAAHITASKIKQLSDVQYIPFTTKNDIRDNYPFGLFSVPQKKIVRLHASSGTTGKPTVVGYTRRDLENWSDCVARFCVSVGVTDEDVAQISFGYGMFTGALGLHYGLEKIGCTVIPVSSGNTEKQIMFIRDLNPTVLASTPSYAMYLSEALHQLEEPPKKLQLRIGLFGSEGCTPALREKIESTLGVFATDNYGISELIGPGVAGECQQRSGLHIAEDHFLPEIIDSLTGGIKPIGETGELVITTLTKEGIPLLRYRTGDITRLDTEPCPCGRTNIRMDKIKGRSDDMIKIRGVKIFPSQIESVLLGTLGVGSSYELVLTRHNYTDQLKIRVETIIDLISKEEIQTLCRKLTDKLKTVLGITIELELLKPGTLRRFEGKAKRIVDLRSET
ncbi:MAG: phenylacetate--CoA ligase [Ruminococcaceae bacterium]|nr:phenylacetate--CoA ligase [Oscillospiraceae bacterium]